MEEIEETLPDGTVVKKRITTQHITERFTERELTDEVTENDPYTEDAAVGDSKGLYCTLLVLTKKLNFMNKATAKCCMSFACYLGYNMKSILIKLTADQFRLFSYPNPRPIPYPPPVNDQCYYYNYYDRQIHRIQKSP